MASAGIERYQQWRKAAAMASKKSAAISVAAAYGGGHGSIMASRAHRSGIAASAKMAMAAWREIINESSKEKRKSIMAIKYRQAAKIMKAASAAKLKISSEIMAMAMKSNESKRRKIWRHQYGIVARQRNNGVAWR